MLIAHFLNSKKIVKKIQMDRIILSSFLCLLLLSGHGLGQEWDDEEYGDRMHSHRRAGEEFSTKHEDADHWMAEAQTMLAAKLEEPEILEAVAKNSIFFLGDGMSLATVTAARIFKGQLDGLQWGGEEGDLSFDKFPNIGVSKTFCVDNQVAESACTATAYLSGSKANDGTIGVKSSVSRGDCAGMMDEKKRTSSLLAWAQAAGKSTGVITTTRITHASPAGTYAHTADRDWENDAEILKDGQDPDACDDIAEQLILKSPGMEIDVIFGGGRKQFTPTSVLDPETNEAGKRTDGKNLIEEWKKMHANEGARAQYVFNKEQFDNIDAKNMDRVLGLFNYDHLDFALDSTEDPSLAEMTKKAIEILSKNEKGFFLFVEGGKIDLAHHEGHAQKALVETIEFAAAIAMADNMTKVDDTLIVVTSDHSHTLTISGYPERGNPLLGIAEISLSDDEYGGVGDDLPYSTLSYANGPGYKLPQENGERYNMTEDDFTDPNYNHVATVPMDSETHGGDDVIIFSRGPFSHLLNGVVQQSYIPHVIGYACQMGPGLVYVDPTATTTTTSTTERDPSGSSGLSGSLLGTVIMALFSIRLFNL